MGDIERVNRADLELQMRVMSDVFEHVILADCESKKEIEEVNGRLRVGRRSCSRNCPLMESGNGCICEEAISKGKETCRFNVSNRTANFVISKPVNLVGKVVNLVMVKKVDAEFAFSTDKIGGAIEEISKISSSLVVDQLTRIYNRKYLEDNVGFWIQKADLEGKEMCLASIDIDNFKRFNDSFGHDFGDKVLKTLAEGMEEVTEDVNGTYPIRIGGDEFMVVSTNGMGRKRFNSLMNKLCSIIKLKELDFEGKKVGITISIGTSSVIEQGNKDYKSLYKEADEALYRAKEAGKNCVR